MLEGGGMRRTAAGVVALVAAACGGGGGGGGSVGTPGTSLVATGPLPLSAANATAVVGGSTCQVGAVSAGVAYAVVLASDQPGICGFLQANQNKANTRSIALALVHVDPTSPTTSLAPGSYAVTANPTTQPTFALVQVVQTNASCQASTLTAASGTVVLSSLANGRVQGTVNAQLAGGGDVTGTFDADPCAVTLAGDVCSGSFGLVNPTCAP